MTHIYRHLTDDGLVSDGTNMNANVDGGTPVPFYAGPPAGKDWLINRMLVMIKDNAVLTADNYGGIDVLTAGNGVTLKVRQGPTGPEVLDLTDNHPIKSNAEWGAFCYDISHVSFGSGDNYVLVRWTFGKSGAPLRLSSVRSEKLVLLVQDNLTGLTGHHFVIQGLEVNTGDTA
jgi:hypothetical protein